jgi:hypothetical protein
MVEIAITGQISGGYNIFYSCPAYYYLARGLGSIVKYQRYGNLCQPDMFLDNVIHSAHAILL